MSEVARPVVLWDIDKLIPYEKNAKKHSEASVEKLAKAMREFGFGPAIQVDVDGVIIAGHGRRLAAIKNGYKRVPVDVRDDLSKVKADALRLADNQVVDNEYDMALLEGEISRLAGFADDFDILSMGFSEHELNFSTEDLGEFNDDVFVEDISSAVEKQADENKAAAEAIDDVAAPVVDALGFKRVTIEQSRTIRALQTKLEAATGLKGAEALIKHLEASL